MFINHLIYVMIIMQVFLYPIIAKLLGYRNTFRFGAALFTVGCILLPLANHISGPIGRDNSNSTNATTMTFTTDNNMVAVIDYNDNHFNHLRMFSTLYGSKYQTQSGILNSAEFNSLDNNSTNNSCHSSHLGSLVGENSVKRIPARVWLTISWIVTMCSIGRFVLQLMAAANHE